MYKMLFNFENDKINSVKQHKKMIKQLTEKLKDLQIEDLARSTFFYKRAPRKISASSFVRSFFSIMLHDKFSLKNWAFHIFELTEKVVSHQSVAKKLGFSTLSFANKLFEKAMIKTLEEGSRLEVNPLISKFNRVLVEDSTCFKLPYNLFPFFPGSNNQAKENATAKVQLCVDIRNNQYSHVKLMSFRDTDAKYADKILTFLNKGDLVLRDLGYWNSKTFDSIAEAGGFFVSRLRSNISVYHASDGSLIDLMAYLKAKDKKGITRIELPVKLTNSNKSFRMVGLKLTDAQLAQRRAQCKRRRRYGKRKGKTRVVLKKTTYLMSWNIFITNVEQDQLKAQQIYSVYALRWNVETIFKHWKSNFKLDNFVKTCTGANPARPKIILMLYLTWIVLSYNPAFNVYQARVYKKAKKILSPAKFANFIKANAQFIDTHSIEKITKTLAYYCCFDLRKDRKNYFEKLNMINLS